MRHLGILAVTAALALAGCSMPKARDEARPSPTPGPTASATASASASDAACRVSGFVPDQRIVLTGARLAVLYGGTVVLAPGGSRSASDENHLLGVVRPGVRVTSPAGATLDPDVARGIATSVKGASARSLPDVVDLPIDVRNDTRRNRAYVAYGASRVYRGTWSARFCGGPVNDGSSVEAWRGTFTTVGPLRTGTVPCDSLGSVRRELTRTVRNLCA